MTGGSLFDYNKNVIIFIVLMIFAGLLVGLHLWGVLSPVESVVAEVPRPFVYVFRGTGNSFKSFFSYFSSVHRLNGENALLEAKVRELEQEKVVLEQAKIENDELKKELQYRATAKMEFISANVISKDPTGFSQTIIVDSGTSNGVKVGAGVLSQGVLVGKVIAAEEFTSKVLLLTDPQSSIDAQISPSGDTGIVRGSYGSGMVLDMISQNVQLNKGDEIVTLGLNQQIPKGILIGTIGQLQSLKNDLLQKASVIPSVDFKTLRYVSIIK